MKNVFVLITGATSGIGEATAKLLAQQGYHLILCGRRQEILKKMKLELIDKYKIEVHILSFDIQDKLSIKKIFKEQQETLRKVSVLINNAGMARGVDPVDNADVDDWDEMIDTNIKGLLYMTRYMLPLLKEKESADIINIGSVSGRWTYAGGAVYCGTKHAVRAISEGIRQDLTGQRVKVCCIEPGLVKTQFSNVRLGDEEKANDVYKGMHPLSAHDIAESILWTLQRPAHVNIQEMVIFPTHQASISQVHRESIE